MKVKKEIKIVQDGFSKGHKLGKLIPRNEFKLLQKQFEMKALDKASKDYQTFRAISLGFDTALIDRGLLKTEPEKLLSLKKLIQNIPNVWEDKQIKKDKNNDNDMEIDM